MLEQRDGTGGHDALAEAYLRRALIAAEMDGQNILSALRSAKADIDAGKHLEASSLVHVEVFAIVRELVTFLSLSRANCVSFQHEGARLDAQTVLDGLAYALGVDESADESEGICEALYRLFAMTAGR